MTYVYLIISVQLILGVIEHYLPARPEWAVLAKEKSINILVAFSLTLIALTLTTIYVELLAEPLSSLRYAAGLDIWPHHWPILGQLLLVFLTSEFLWYWMHRAEHRWVLIWRLSGHGAHHAFKKINAPKLWLKSST